MSAGSDGVGSTVATKPKTPARPARAGGWKWRGRSPLKLVGARNGDGVLMWSGFAIPAAYELDVFSLGDAHSVQGTLEGDFSSLMRRGEARVRESGGARLRLDDGHELDIDVGALGQWCAEFDVQGADTHLTLAPLRFENWAAAAA
jgi:hypothetical protein